jgi:hypothetical protein
MSFLNPIILFTCGKADIEDPPLEEYPISIVIKQFFMLCRHIWQGVPLYTRFFQSISHPDSM